MDDSEAGGPADQEFVGGPLAPGFARRLVKLAPGQVRAYEEVEWRDALVVVACGELDLECRAGGHRRFAAGSILWMDGLGLRFLHNPGIEPTVLIAISRRSRPSS